jgi:vacuolar-type H+-ATPase subunit E/Vma4
MPLQDLLNALEREATTQAEALLAAAHAEAAEIAREADGRLARRRSDLLGSREAELRGVAATALGEARRKSRSTVLQARQRLLERVLAAARAQLPEALTSDAYRAALPEHVIQGLRAIGDEPAVIRCPEALVPVVQAVVASRHDVSVQGEPAGRSGVIIATADGAIEADNTLDGRIERMGPQLALEVLARFDKKP